MEHNIFTFCLVNGFLIDETPQTSTLGHAGTRIHCSPNGLQKYPNSHLSTPIEGPALYERNARKMENTDAFFEELLKGPLANLEPISTNKPLPKGPLLEAMEGLIGQNFYKKEFVADYILQALRGKTPVIAQQPSIPYAPTLEAFKAALFNSFNPAPPPHPLSYADMLQLITSPCLQHSLNIIYYLQSSLVDFCLKNYNPSNFYQVMALNETCPKLASWGIPHENCFMELDPMMIFLGIKDNYFYRYYRENLQTSHNYFMLYYTSDLPEKIKNDFSYGEHSFMSRKIKEVYQSVYEIISLTTRNLSKLAAKNEKYLWEVFTQKFEVIFKGHISSLLPKNFSEEVAYLIFWNVFPTLIAKDKTLNIMYPNLEKVFEKGKGLGEDFCNKGMPPQNLYSLGDEQGEAFFFKEVIQLIPDNINPEHRKVYLNTFFNGVYLAYNKGRDIIDIENSKLINDTKLRSS